MRRLLRRFLPRGFFGFYHRFLAMAGAVWYGFPSRNLVVIGVTGTDGKTTTAHLTAHLLSKAGPVGLSSTMTFQVGDHRWPNDQHLTTPGRFTLQRLLRQMVNAGCEYAVIEFSSEGLAQGRHVGINVDIAILTNLTPEHIEAHGSLEAYRQAKELLFQQLAKGQKKIIGKRRIPKISVINLDDPLSPFFLRFPSDIHFCVSLDPQTAAPSANFQKLVRLTAQDIQAVGTGYNFLVEGQSFHLSLRGRYNILNALQAMAVAHAMGVGWEKLAQSLSLFAGVAGRGEEIKTGKPWKVIVDYALTPAALKQFYQALKEQGAKRIIAVFGAAGGGRDRWKRPKLGAIASKYCARIILTTDDPYDEEPMTITKDIQRGIPSTEQKKVEIILDRRAAIQRVLALAEEGDIVAITGMGAETSMVQQGKRLPWNDKEVVEEILAVDNPADNNLP